MSGGIARVQSADPAVNRLQDQLVRELNPLLRRLARPVVVEGSRGSGAALASLLEALEALGLITDKTTP